MRLIPLALGLVAVFVVGVTHLASSPTAITWGGRDFHLDTHHEDEAECFDFVTASTTELTLCGSLDTLCDPPQAHVLDVDGDGQREVVVTTCNGTHLVSWHDGTISEKRVR